MKKIFVAVLAALALSACAGSGSIDWDNARKIKKGMSKAEVVKLMGQPYSVIAKGKGEQRYIWVHANGLTGSSSSLGLDFKDGIMVSDLEIPKEFQ